MNMIVATSSTGTVTYLFLLLLIAAIAGLVILRRGEALCFETAASADQVTMVAVEEVGGKRRWTTLSQAAGSVTFSYYKRPNVLLVLLLAIFVISIPLAILYVLLAGKRESLSVYSAAVPSGATRVQITSNGWRGKSAGRAIRGGLTAELGAVPQAVVAPKQPVLSAAEQPAIEPVCGNCGEPLAATAKFCSSCGASVR